MLNLPWFVTRQIIDFTLTPNNRHLCLINKEWYEYGAGRFLVLKGEKKKQVKQASKWLFNAETLWTSFCTKSNLKTAGKLQNIKTVIFDTTSTFKVSQPFMDSIDLGSLKQVVVNCVYETDEVYYFDFFTLIKDRLQTLKIKQFDPRLKVDALIKVGFPNLTKFECQTSRSPITFIAIKKFMPKLKHLELNMCDIDFEYDTLENPEFECLEILDMDHCFNMTFKSDGKRLCDFRFPELKTLKVDDFSIEKELDNFPHFMPQLKRLEIIITMYFGQDYSIPDTLQPNLEKLLIHQTDDVPLENTFRIDLAKAPKLRSLKLNANFKFLNLEKTQLSTIKNVELIPNFFIFPYRYITDQFPFLEKVTFDCQLLANNSLDISKLFSSYRELSLINLKTEEFSNMFRTSFFKTTKLKLAGEYSISNQFLDWLAKQFQLEHLTISYDSNRKLSLKPVTLPKLQYLKIVTSSEDTYLQLHTALFKRGVYAI